MFNINITAYGTWSILLSLHTTKAKNVYIRNAANCTNVYNIKIRNL